MKNKMLFAISALLMVLLGTSDALRGLFSPLCLKGFGFSESAIGVIVSASYLGNLVFLLFGGSLLDKLGLKKSMIIFIFMMMLSLLLLVFGYIYAILIAGFFLTLGLSTLLNTSINIASDSFSETKSLVYLNILFFMQGIGTSGSQLLLSPFSESQGVWNITLITLALLMIPILIILTKSNMKERKEENVESTRNEGKIEYKGLVLLVLALSFYTIAEHGVTNYIISYGIAEGNTSAVMGRYLALYSLGIMSGRLILGALMAKLGERKMISLSLILGTISFFLIFFCSMLFLTFIAGFVISTLYPTLVALSRNFVPPSYGSRATTRVVSLASVFDIIFNFSFGFMTERFTFQSSMKILPLMMALALIVSIPLLRKRPE